MITQCPWCHKSFRWPNWSECATEQEFQALYLETEAEVDAHECAAPTRCSECGRIFTQGTDSGRPEGECPGCGHVNSVVNRVFGVEYGEELVMLLDYRGAQGLDLYVVPAGTDNAHDAVKYRRAAHWNVDGSYGQWILYCGEPSGITEKWIAPYIGEAH